MEIINSAWEDEVRRELEKIMTPKDIAKLHKKLLTSSSDKVALGALKELYGVGGVGKASSNSVPHIILNIAPQAGIPSIVEDIRIGNGG